MAKLAASFERDRLPNGEVALHFTPAEWRAVLEDPDFIREIDNSFVPPRRLMGVPVTIVPDHRFG